MSLSLSSDSYSTSSLMDASSLLVVRKYFPVLELKNQLDTVPSLKPASKTLLSPPTDVEKNCRPPMGYKRTA